MLRQLAPVSQMKSDDQPRSEPCERSGDPRSLLGAKTCGETPSVRVCASSARSHSCSKTRFNAPGKLPFQNELAQERGLIRSEADFEG